MGNRFNLQLFEKLTNQLPYSDKMDNIFYAHSTKLNDKSDWQLLKDHLANVGELAGGFAEAFNCGEYGKAAGLLHDLGKYTVEFQKRLENMSLISWNLS